MHVLFVLDPLPLLKAYKDSSVAMMRALVARGHTLSVAMQGDLYIEEGAVRAVATPIELVDGADLHGHDWWREAEARDVRLADLGAVVMRKDPPFDMEYVYSTHLLEYAQQQGAKVFNTGAAIRNHPEKLAITEISEFTAPTLVTRNMARLKAFHDKHQDVIVKPLDGMGGTGVFRLQPGSQPQRHPGNADRQRRAHHHGAALHPRDRQGRQAHPADRRRARAVLPGPHPAGRRNARQPGGRRTWRGPAAVAARPRDRRGGGAKLAARGLLLVGLDVIGDYVTEVNVTSPTCFVEIAEQTGFDVAGMFAQALEKAAA